MSDGTHNYIFTKQGIVCTTFNYRAQREELLIANEMLAAKHKKHTNFTLTNSQTHLNLAKHIPLTNTP